MSVIQNIAMWARKRKAPPPPPPKRDKSNALHGQQKQLALQNVTRRSQNNRREDLNRNKKLLCVRCSVAILRQNRFYENRGSERNRLANSTKLTRHLQETMMEMH